MGVWLLTQEADTDRCISLKIVILMPQFIFFKYVSEP